MAKATIDLTDSYQKIASGACIITVIARGDDPIYFNDVASNTNALKRSNTRILAGHQFIEDEARDVFAKGAGWSVIVDGVL